jgi:hypothetical protein
MSSSSSTALVAAASEAFCCCNCLSTSPDGISESGGAGIVEGG